MIGGNQLVKALLSAIAIINDIVEFEPESNSALNGLEGIADHLGSMDEAERDAFIALLDRIASEESDSSYAAWIRNVPAELGLRWNQADLE